MSTQLAEAPAKRKPPYAGPEQRQRGWSLGKVLGLEVTLDSSWIFIFTLITLSLFGSLVVEFPGLPVATYWIGALGASVAFFLSLLLHELAHSWVARARGIGVHGITLFFFGGVSRLREEPRRASDEFLMAVVGPVASAVLGLVFLSFKFLLPERTLVAGVFGWLGTINLALAAFNMLPGFPLDGGRILRAAIWGVTGNFTRATRIAAGVGIGIAWLLIGWGAFQLLYHDRFLNGLWLGFLGWFLMTAAQRSMLKLDYDRVLDRLKVGDIMRADLLRVSPDESVERFIQEFVLRTGDRCQMVTDDNVNLLGLITLHEVKTIPREKWSTTVIRDVMIPWERLRTTTAEGSLLDALELMNTSGVHQLPVVEGTTLCGVITRGDLLRRLAVHLEVAKTK